MQIGLEEGESCLLVVGLRRPKRPQFRLCYYIVEPLTTDIEETFNLDFQVDKKFRLFDVGNLSPESVFVPYIWQAVVHNLLNPFSSWRFITRHDYCSNCGLILE